MYPPFNPPRSPGPHIPAAGRASLLRRPFPAAFCSRISLFIRIRRTKTRKSLEPSPEWLCWFEYMHHYRRVNSKCQGHGPDFRLYFSPADPADPPRRPRICYNKLSCFSAPARAGCGVGRKQHQKGRILHDLCRNAVPAPGPRRRARPVRRADPEVQLGRLGGRAGRADRAARKALGGFPNPFNHRLYPQQHQHGRPVL